MENISYAMNSHQFIENSKTNTTIKEEEDLDEKPFMDMSIEPNFQELYTDHNLSNVEYKYTPEKSTENPLYELKIKKKKREDVDYDGVLSNENSSTNEFNSSEQSVKELFTCAVCTKSVKTKQSIRGHMRIHTGERPFKCDVCEKSFNQKTILLAHMRIHTGERPFKCNVCQKSFRYSNDQIRHTKSHTDEKPFKCDICKKQFHLSSGLRQHMKSHTGEKPFKCDVCKKSYISNYRLTIHTRIHTGEKPYKCVVCEKSFADYRLLTAHKKTHTRKGSSSCNVCKKPCIHCAHLLRLLDNDQQLEVRGLHPDRRRKKFRQTTYLT